MSLMMLSVCFCGFQTFIRFNNWLMTTYVRTIPLEICLPSWSIIRVRSSEFMRTACSLNFIAAVDLPTQNNPLCQVALTDLPLRYPRLLPVSFALIFKASINKAILNSHIVTPSFTIRHWVRGKYPKTPFALPNGQRLKLRNSKMDLHSVGKIKSSATLFLCWHRRGKMPRC